MVVSLGVPVDVPVQVVEGVVEVDVVVLDLVVEVGLEVGVVQEAGINQVPGADLFLELDHDQEVIQVREVDQAARVDLDLDPEVEVALLPADHPEAGLEAGVNHVLAAGLDLVVYLDRGVDLQVDLDPEGNYNVHGLYPQTMYVCFS